MKIGKAKLEVVSAKITEVTVDALVNPANNMLWMGGGISALIRKKGGESIESEALTKAPAALGGAVVTGAGKLAAKKVIHAVITDQNLAVEESVLRKAVTSSLAAADAIGCVSLAIPMLISENSHFEIHIAARIMVGETVQYLVQDNKTIEYVLFAGHDKDTSDIFDRALMEMFSQHG